MTKTVLKVGKEEFGEKETYHAFQEALMVYFQEDHISFVAYCNNKNFNHVVGATKLDR